VGRSLIINGETMVMCRGGAHMSGSPISYLSELGLAGGQVTVTPTFYHDEVKATGFGPHMPADLQVQLAGAEIEFVLIHFDADVLETLIDESLANGGIEWSTGGLENTDGGRAGTLAPTGSLLGKRLAMYESGCNYFSLNLLSPVLEDPWRFRRCVLASRPVAIPLGTHVSEVRVNVRALPYADPYRSGMSGRVITDFASESQLGAAGGVLRSGLLFSKRKEVLGSGAVLFDRELDQSEVIG
jgi:hypothetical protein